MGLLRRVLSGVLLACVSAAVPAQPLPHLVTQGGKHSLIVDGAPFLILGGQANNSSNYPAMLPKVWPVIHQFHANTIGGAAVIQLGPDEFLVAGSDVRLRFGLAQPPAGANSQFLDVEEGTFKNGRWVMARRWNGDQTDYGLNLTTPALLKVRLGTYR